MIVAIWFIVYYLPIEQFVDIFNTSMIEFTRLDGSIIKKVKVGSSSSLYDQEVLNLFRQDDVIKVTVPSGYKIKIIYKFKKSG